MAKLIIQTGKLAGKQLAIPTKEVLIGRDEGCYIRMGSPEISRQHCSLRLTPDGIQVTDLGSSNGTWVNDVQITAPTILKGGDLLRVGPATFLVDGPKPVQELEHDIVDWLTDGDSKTGMVSDEDTAIFKTSKPPADSEATVMTSAAPHPKIKRVFKTIAEEARYIIALHKELKAAQQDQSP